MTDARNISLTAEATTAAERIKDRLQMNQMLDVIRLGVAYAIRHGLPLSREHWGSKAGGANYNVATVDTEDGTFRRMIAIFYDDVQAIKAPYATIETLMNNGVMLLRDHLEDGTVQSLGDLAPDEPSSSSQEDATLLA